MYKTLVAAIAAALSAPLQAQSTTEQPQVVVTATRTAQTVDQTLASVSVITRADIEASQAPDLLELLRLQPGVDLNRGGGTGQTTTLFLRGTNSNHTLVLIDGIRVASTNSGLFDFAHLPLDQIERIEIVRGPRAAYWGSDAIGGVIQIFTRAPSGTSAHAYGGRYGRLGGSAAAGFSGERGALGMTLGGEKFDGFSAQNPSGFSFDPDDDGYLNRNVSLRGRTALGSHELAATFLHTNADVEFDQGRSEAKNQSAGVELSGPIATHWSHRLTVGSAREDLETPDYFSLYQSRRETLDWQHQVRIAQPLDLVFGVNLEHARGESRDTFSGDAQYRATRNQWAQFAGLQGQHEAFDWQLAARYDHDNAFGGEFTPQLAFGWQASSGLRATASYGEGFRAPNLNELYSPGFGGLFAGNPELEAEHSRSLEAGLDAQLDTRQRLGVHAYRTRIDDLIVFAGGNDFHAINVKRARVDGVELTYAASFGRWQIDANATVQAPIDQENDKLLLRRPRRKAAAVLGYTFDCGLELGAEGYVASARRDFDGNLPGYALLNVRASWPLMPQLHLDLRIDNALDREYSLASGFNTPDRAWLLGVRWSDE
jgi:vitamin B12 transporter